MSRFSAPIAEQIWDMKYRLKAADGSVLDQTVEDSWRRIARALAAVETDPGTWEPRFYAALEDFRYLPAGRITAGAGTGRSVTLFNCFVMGTIPDSMGGIFDALREAALTGGLYCRAHRIPDVHEADRARCLRANATNKCATGS